jgi:group I intron endonuclease
MPKVSWKSGVYIITNTVNGKVYIGSAAESIDRRLYAHRYMLDAGTHPNIHLQRSWDKHGEEAFTFAPKERCRPEDCIKREQHWLDNLECCKKGFNICPTAGSRLGTMFSEESKRKISVAHKGRKASPEARAKMSATRKGKRHTEQSREKMKENSWARGPKAEEIAAKISAGLKSRPHNPERVAKMAATKRGKPMSFKAREAQEQYYDRLRRENGGKVPASEGHWSKDPDKKAATSKKISEARLKGAQERRDAEAQAAHDALMIQGQKTLYGG